MTIYERMIHLFNTANITYCEKTHPNEGYGEHIAKIHALPEEYGAKALVLKLKYYANHSDTNYCLAIVPFTEKVDLDLVKKNFSAKKISFASKEESEIVTGCVSGSVPPFTFNSELPLLIDESILHAPTLFFNAGRLDRSVSLDIEGFEKIIDLLPSKYVFAKIT